MSSWNTNTSMRYRGNDPELRRLFDAIFHNFANTRIDPVYKITGRTAIVGQYTGVSLGIIAGVDGVTTPATHWGMNTDPTNSALIIVNSLESWTNASHFIPNGTILIGARRPATNGSEVIFVQYPREATNSVDAVFPGNDGNPPGPGEGISGPQPVMPATKTLVIAGSSGGYDGTWTANYNSGLNKYIAFLPAGKQADLEVETSPTTHWIAKGNFGTGPDLWDSGITQTPPPNGVYNFRPLFGAGTCTVS